ncbi:hypothetical protein [Streptomyces justiciae]|uniref:hypothetical protein n=1 Tax=Streptomyces justiciae TaxID=2780140 RepID=UPI001880B38B|nr:hypothetical protein [Streptomyces justiciae]MBE8472122.1 hypothetical protein [Streptomyces justiciae]
MTASVAVRSVRAAVFAVLCVLLATGGHALATGEAPPVWVQIAAAVPVFAVGCLLAGRERSLTGIGTVTLAAQGALHVAFHSVRQQHTAMAVHGMRMTMPAHSHALTPHATAVHVGAALTLTWWLRRGEAALWSLLRWAIAFVPGLVAWWRADGGVPDRSLPGPRTRMASRSLRSVRLRYAVRRRGPPTGMSYAV